MKNAREKSKSSSFKAVLLGGRVFSNSQSAFTLYDQSGFGEPQEGKVYYSLIEALYLAEKGKIAVFKSGKKISFNSLFEECQKTEQNVHTKFIVFRDMRNKGYTVKTALKFGADFRVYEKGVKPGQEHAKWILYAVDEAGSMTWHEFAAKNRVAHSTKKNLLIGIADAENDVTYYEIAWKKP